MILKRKPTRIWGSCTNHFIPLLKTNTAMLRLLLPTRTVRWCHVLKLQAILLVFQFSSRHGLSGKTFTELLQVLSVLLPQGNLLPKSVYLFKKSLIQLFPEAQDVKKHNYCASCFKAINEGQICGCNTAILHYPPCTPVERKDCINLHLIPDLLLVSGDCVHVCTVTVV